MSRLIQVNRLNSWFPMKAHIHSGKKNGSSQKMELKLNLKKEDKDQQLKKDSLQNPQAGGKSERNTRSWSSQTGKRLAKHFPQNIENLLLKTSTISGIDIRSEAPNRYSQDYRKRSLHRSEQIKASSISERQVRGKISTQPSLNIKEEMMRRIAKKIEFMKHMTSQEKKNLYVGNSQEKCLFKFDKLYEHCLKNINKCVNLYEKDLSKEKDKKYYQLKIEGDILAKQLRQLRGQILINTDKQENTNFGVVGSTIEVRSGEKIQFQRIGSCSHKKKAKKMNSQIVKEVKNPFRMDDMDGWEIRLEKSEQFYI